MVRLVTLGFHYYPDDQHYTQRELEHWVPILRGLGAGAIVLTSTPQRSVPEPFVTGLLDGGIEPIVRLPVPVGSVSVAELEPLLRGYGRWGVRHVVTFDKPNVRTGWAQASDWGKPGLIERFLDRAIPVWEAQVAAGLKAVFPALEPGGDYWDTAFLEAALSGLVKRGADALLGDMVLAIYSWTYGRSLDWGLGGPAKWPEARPYRTPEGCQDQRGLRLCEWYRAAASKAGAPPMPMLVVAGGALPGEGASDASGDIHAERNLSIARLLSQGEIPAYVQTFSFFLLATAEDDPLAAAAWFAADGTPRPVVAAFRKLSPTFEKPSKALRPIHHYLLLDPTSLSRWEELADFVAAFRPTVGFSIEEARHADQVSLVGDSVSDEVETRLQDAGCRVQRLSPHSFSRRPAQPSFPPRPANVAAMLAGVIHG